MLTRLVAPALAALLLAAAAPARAVEIVFVPPVQNGALTLEPAASGCQAPACGRPRAHWGHCFGHKRPVCDPCSLPNAGFYPTRWRYLPPEPEYHHAPAAPSAPAESPAANGPDNKAEKLPAPTSNKPLR
jgi:hypothetical protein